MVFVVCHGVYISKIGRKHDNPPEKPILCSFYLYTEFDSYVVGQLISICEEYISISQVSEFPFPNIGSCLHIWDNLESPSPDCAAR